MTAPPLFFRLKTALRYWWMRFRWWCAGLRNMETQIRLGRRRRLLAFLLEIYRQVNDTYICEPEVLQ